MIGDNLEQYEITSHLGTGGRGEVYPATDGRFGRRIAIKLLSVWSAVTASCPMVCALLLFGLVGYAQTPAVPALRATLTPNKQQYFVGEDITVNYCVENAASTPFDAWAGNGFKPVVTNSAGATMPPLNLFEFSEIFVKVRVAPGGRWCRPFQLMRLVRIDREGEYALRASFEFSPDPASDGKFIGPEARTSFTMRVPTEAEAESVLAAMETKAPASRTDSPNPYDSVSIFSAAYLGPLRKRAEAGNSNAVRAIGKMPEPEATRILIELTKHSDVAIARAASRNLTLRLPPAMAGVLGIPSDGGRLGTFDGLGTDGTVFPSSWRQDFAGDVRAIAKKLLVSSDIQSVQEGAYMLASVGESEDAPEIAVALTEAIKKIPLLPPETDSYPRSRGAARQLLRTAKAIVWRGYLPPTSGRTSGDMAFQIVAIAAGRSEGSEAIMAQALRHESPYIREIALDLMPLPVPTALAPEVDAALRSSDIDLQVAACQVASRAKLTDLRAAALEAYRKTSDTVVFLACGNALYDIGVRTERLDIAAARLAEPGTTGRMRSYFLDALYYSVFDGMSGGGGQEATAAQARVLSTRWQEFLTAHRTEIESGKRWFLDDPAITPDLVPPNWHFNRPGKPAWPPR